MPEFYSTSVPVIASWRLLSIFSIHVMLYNSATKWVRIESTLSVRICDCFKVWIAVFCVVMLCALVGCSHRFVATCRLHLQSAQKTTRRHNPEDQNHILAMWKLQFHTIFNGARAFCNLLLKFIFLFLQTIEVEIVRKYGVRLQEPGYHVSRVVQAESVAHKEFCFLHQTKLLSLWKNTV